MDGEPLEPENLEAVKTIARLTRSHDKNTAVWSGYYLEEMNKAQLEALEDVDILIDGPYLQELSDPYHLVWMGSSNQHLYKKENGIWVNMSHLK